LEHVPPGKHGFHIHENGDCGDGGKAAGGHYNPNGVSHGLLLRDGFQKAHAGDLGNVEIDANGRGKLEAVLPGLTLAGENTTSPGNPLSCMRRKTTMGSRRGMPEEESAAGSLR